MIPPKITVQPTDQSMVVPGSSSTFTITMKAIPGHNYTYQWQKNKTNIPEATSGNLTISGVTKSDDEAIYCCIVSNAAGSVTSDPAELTVCKSNYVYLCINFVYQQINYPLPLFTVYLSRDITRKIRAKGRKL